MVAGKYEKVSRKVLSSNKSRVHNGVDFAPSICIGLYVDRSLNAPPVIEMAFLNNGYGKQAGMHFQDIAPQILPRAPDKGWQTSKAAKVKGGLWGSRQTYSGGVFSDYVASEQVRLKSAVQGSVKATATNAVAANLRKIIEFKDPTPGGSNMPSSKPESAEGAAAAALDSVSFTNLGLIADLAEGKVSSATAKMAVDTASALKKLFEQATHNNNPVATEIWDYMQGRAAEIASRIAHPDDISMVAEDINAYIQETEYLSLNLLEVDILTIDVIKPPSKETENRYNFDHDVEVMGMFWRIAPSGDVIPDGYLSHRQLAEQGFSAGASEFREYQAMMPQDSREFVMKGNIPAQDQPTAQDNEIKSKPTLKVDPDARSPNGP